ncbi:MAG: hypothetical protein SGJ18_14380 [Pseudomonadota bacterium]|nr:hypothetical protein [Pseudomonadota bacterium]
MSLELVLLLFLYVILLGGAFMGDNGPRATFKESAPRLAARIEQQLATGADFNDPKNLGQKQSFKKPSSKPPGGW